MLPGFLDDSIILQYLLVTLKLMQREANQMQGSLLVGTCWAKNYSSRNILIGYTFYIIPHYFPIFKKNGWGVEKKYEKKIKFRKNAL